MKFQYEQQAYDNAPLPDNLGLADTFMFLSLRTIYQQYRNKHLPKERAQAEKTRLMATYNELILKEKAHEKACTLYNRADLAYYPLVKALEGKDLNEIIKRIRAFVGVVYGGVLPKALKEVKDD